MSFIAAHPTAIPPARLPSVAGNPESISSWQSVAYESSIIERPGTPFIKRVSSVRLADDESNKTTDQLPSLLDLDLSERDSTILNEIVDLVDYVFPASVLPFKVDDDFVDKCRNDLGDIKYVWCRANVPNPNVPNVPSEPQLAKFLNTICKTIASVSGQQVLRNWDANYCNTPLRGSPIRRKPDVVLLDCNFAGTGPPKWQNVHAVAELTTSSSEHHRIIRTVTDKTYVMLGVQPNRVFVPIISAWGRSKFRLTVTDRQGQLRTKTFDIDSGVRRADLRTLIHILVGLCFGGNDAVGYDKTMIMGRGNVKAIMCDGKEFTVIKLIYATQSLIGRATRVWVVEHNGRKYILKDAWIEACRPVSEAEHLKKVAGIQGVPQLFCAEDIPGLSTGNLRYGLHGDKSRERIRRRIVTSPCGAHIASFRSKRELISALRDIVITLKTLATDKQLVHRDISYNNILLLEPQEDDEEEGHRRGLLIDLEYAASLVTAQSTSPGRRTGTVPFMAVELLLEGKVVTHRPSHDLESLFYVLIYICTNLGGPDTPRSLEELLEFTSLPIAAWFAPEASFESLATSKLGLAHAFEKRIADRFSPYFTDIKPCVMELFRAMYPNGPQIQSALTHDRMIEIFTATLKTLPSVDQYVPRKPVNPRKHSLCIYDNCVFFSEKKRRTLALNPSISTSGISTPSEQLRATRRHRQSTSDFHDTLTQ